MDGTYSLSDIASVTRDNDNFAGGSWWVILLFLFAMGGNGFGFGNRSNVATTEDLASGFNFSALQNKTNEILAAVNGVNQNLSNAVCTSTYELASKIDNCCCETNRNIDSVRYENAMNTAAINANTTAGIQKILDKMCENQMAAMQNQINQLQLNSALCGVVRYPTATTYATTCNPFFGGFNCNCGCSNI